MNGLFSKQICGWLLCGFLLLMVSACASRKPPWRLQYTKQYLEVSEKGWWCATFRINWPENTPPSMYIDVCLAHQVLLPILNDQKDNLILWRFHRRAARDQAGHQLSLIFYASPETANQIFDSLSEDRLLTEMQDTGIIIHISYDDTTTITKPNIEDTSDPNWSPEIQKSWPYFIMGVCQMWLTSIREIAENTPPERNPSSLQEMLTFYQGIDEALRKLWQEEGRHSLLHHLNAIFGYQPVKLNRGDILFQF